MPELREAEPGRNRCVAGAAVIGLKDGDRIRLGPDDFERLSAAFFTDLERKFVAKV